MDDHMSGEGHQMADAKHVAAEESGDIKDEALSDASSTEASAAIDDGLREVPELRDWVQNAAKAAPAFVLTRLDAMVKAPLREELSEPDASAGSACSCNSVCSCVPVETCACNQVCTCDTVDTCPSYESTCYGGGGGYGGYYAPC